jgi:hypothetical protein
VWNSELGQSEFIMFKGQLDGTLSLSANHWMIVSSTSSPNGYILLLVLLLLLLREACYFSMASSPKK